MSLLRCGTEHCTFPTGHAGLCSKESVIERCGVRHPINPNLFCLRHPHDSGDHENSLQRWPPNLVEAKPTVHNERSNLEALAKSYATEMTNESYNHYFKDVSQYSRIDVYRILELFDIRDPCFQHAIKKLLVAGGRGSKGLAQDIHEVIVSLERWEQMQREDIHGRTDSD